MRPIFLVVATFFGILSCSINSSDIPTLEVGQEFSNSNVRLLVLDTFQVQTSTFKFDSINSSDNNRLLIGGYEDPYFGRIRTSAFFELQATNSEDFDSPFALSEDARFDSIALILGYDGYFYNDTLPEISIAVHEILEDFQPEEDFFYNRSTLEVDSIPLARHLYRPEPNDEDSVHIRLPDAFGENLFELFLENDIDENDEIRQFFNGLHLSPGDNENGAVIGFSKNSQNTYLRFFYSLPGEFGDEESQFDMVINTSPLVVSSFNRIEDDPLNSPLAGLTDQEIELPSLDAQNLSFIQAGTAYALKITFPSLRKLYDISGTGTVLNAVLRLKPLRESYSDLRPLSDSLNVNVLDRNNEVLEPLTTGEGTVFGRITGEEEEFSEVVYEIPVGVFVDRKLQETGTENVSLVLFTQNYNETVNRLVLQGGQNADFKAQLEITYAVYED